MKRPRLPILVLLFVSALAFSEGAPRGGDFGIQGGVVFTTLNNRTASFSISPNGSIGVKYFFSENFALRAGLGIVNDWESRPYSALSTSFSNNFSWAGEFGVGYDSLYDPTPPATTSTFIGTIGFGTFLTYYLN